VEAAAVAGHELASSVPERGGRPGRVRCRVMVRGRMAVGESNAAADVAAGQADPEVQPLAAVPKALLAAVDGRRELA